MSKLFIDGKWVDAVSGETISVVSPVDGEAFDAIARGRDADVDAAVSAARRAHEGAWGRLSATERGRILTKLAQRIADNTEELARLEARDTGKPMSTARNDIQVLARYFEFYAGAADKVHGQIIPFLNGYTVSLLREPLGVTAHIIPWNYPAQMLGRTIAPALAMGNATVLKPAEDACLSTLRVAQLAVEAGLPDGALNVVTGYGHEAGAALAGHPGIDFVTFTGSNEVGTLVQQAAARNAVKCVLELGGKSPQIVFADVDAARAVPTIVKAIVQNTGQTCTAGSRLLVERSIYEKFVGQIGEAFAAVRVGTPEMDFDCGPVVNRTQFERVNAMVDAAKRGGVPVVSQGQLASNLPRGGYFVQPTLFGNVPVRSDLAQKEVFGPVLAAFPFDDEADAIALANSTDYGLLAAVWTENGGRQQRVAKAVRCGQVFVNCYGAGGGVELPFGGVKRSGHGREKGFLALEEMSTTKTVVQFHG
ncbi:MAG TPA: aldehyde dehydrogenase family protein [Casimicrobiaceae bacterium]|nr:aldehyde dehydrogenase family protein [Casimicrobiaceae bacterium]